MWVNVESFKPASTAGLHGSVHIRPCPDQGFDTRLMVRCSRELVDTSRYPLGTRFRIRAKLTDREGGGEFLSSWHGWAFEVLD
jgi:hypothetical protein